MKRYLRIAEKLTFMASLVCCMAATGSAFAATYPSASNGTEPNVWTRNYSGVVAAAKTTGYPIFLIVVNSPSCGHCSAMMDKTVNTAEFAAMESELTFYKVIVDEAYSGGSSDYMTCISKYKSYFDYGMYPAVVVLRKDGSAYGGFGNKTTDRQNVTPEIRNMIEFLALEQNVDIWSGSGVTPSIPEDQSSGAGASETSSESKVSVADLKGSGNGVVFDANQKIVAFCTLKITAKGRVTAKFTSNGGRKTEKGDVVLSADGILRIKSASLDIFYDNSAAFWRGDWDGNKVFVPFAAKSSDFGGLYTLSAQTANGEKAGYLTAKITSGKGKVSGMLNGKNKVSVGGVAVLLPAAVVADAIPNWSVGQDLLFVPVVKRGGISGGIALTRNGLAFGMLHALGVNWEASGGKWLPSASLAPMDGSLFSVSCKDIDILVSVSGGSSIEFGINEYAAKMKATVRTGMFKGNLKSGGEKISFSGVFIRDGETVVGRGVTLEKGFACPVSIASPCGGSCSVAE